MKPTSLKESDIPQLKALMRLKPSIEDTAAFFECSTRTIMKFTQENFNLNFAEFREQHMVHTRFAIVRKAIEKATKGDNVMLIFCLKNLCGWKDKWDNSDDTRDRAPTIAMTDEQYKEYVELTIAARKAARVLQVAEKKVD